MLIKSKLTVAEKKRNIRTNWGESVVPARVPPNRMHNSPIRPTKTVRKSPTQNSRKQK